MKTGTSPAFKPSLWSSFKSCLVYTINGFKTKKREIDKTALIKRKSEFLFYTKNIYIISNCHLFRFFPSLWIIGGRGWRGARHSVFFPPHRFSSGQPRPTPAAPIWSFSYGLLPHHRHCHHELEGQWVKVNIPVAHPFSPPPTTATTNSP